MSILAAPTTNPAAVALPQSSDLISNLGPLLNLALQFHQTLSSATLVFFIRTYLTARLVGTALFLTSRLAALQALIISRALTISTTSVARWIAWTIWNCKKCRRLRKKLEFEFFALVLGPGGNALFLVLFWPGWIFLGAAFYGLRVGVS